MGRSVDYLSDAQHVLYLDNSNDNEDPDMSQFYWDELKSEITECFNSYPSLITPRKERWDGRETSIILENSLAEVGLSEYCGLVSVSIRAQDDEHVHLGIHWIDKIWPGIIKEFKAAFPTRLLTKRGTLSNGEGVYQRI